MPLITRVYIKAALIYLAAALLAAGLQALGSVPGAPGLLSALSPVQIHLFLVGWITLLIFGVVIWMFPKYSMQKPRGHEPLAWTALALLNIGLLLRVVGEPMLSEQPGTAWGAVLAASAALQWIAGILLVIYTWSRVKER